MSLVFFDGFDSYSSNTELVASNPITVAAFAVSTTGGRFGLGRVNQTNDGGHVTYNFSPTVGEFWQGFGIRFENAGSSAGEFLQYLSPAGVEWSVGSDSSTKNLYVWRGSRTGTLVAQTSAAFLGSTNDSSGPYFWIDARYKWGNNNNGAFELWVGGRQLVSLSSVNTVTNVAQTAISNTKLMGYQTGGPGSYNSYDDWYIVSVDGTSPNTKLGDIRIARLDPNTDFITSGTATPGPAYYTGVDDGATANTNDYITFNNTPGENVAFGVTALPSNATTVYGISIITQQSKSDAGSANARHIVISNGSQSNGNVFILSTTNLKTKTYFPTDPYTSAGWTNTAVANVKIGFGVDA